jgi:hypothetical protein
VLEKNGGGRRDSNSRPLRDGEIFNVTQLKTHGTDGATETFNDPRKQFVDPILDHHFWCVFAHGRGRSKLTLDRARTRRIVECPTSAS